MKRDDIALAVFGTVMFGVVGLVIAGDVTGRLCEGVDLANFNEGRPAFSCFEFWLNRYQTAWSAILAVTATIAAALLAWAAVQRQLQQAREQTAVSQWQTATAAIAMMNVDFYQFSKAEGTQGGIIYSLSIAEMEQIPPKSIQNIKINDDEVLLSISTLLSAAPPWAAETIKIRRKCIDSLQAYSLSCDAILRHILMNEWDEAKGYGAEITSLIRAANKQRLAHSRKMNRFYKKSIGERSDMIDLSDRLRSIVFRK